MRWRSVAKGILVVAIALEALYALPVNVVLNTPLRSRLLNRRPDRFFIDWTLAVSPWPGLVYLRGVRTGGQSRAIQWEASLRAVSATFAMRPLRRRIVDLHDVRAEGVRYAQRPRLSPGETSLDAPEWPPLSGRKNPPDPAPGQDPGASAKKPGEPWTVRASRIRCGVEEIWIGRYRIAGPAEVDAALDLTARGPVALPRIDYRLKAGAMQVGETKMFEGLELDVRARLEPFVPRGRKAVDVFRALSGEFTLDARDGSLKFLEAYFRKVQGLRLDGGGPMRLHLLVRQGRLLEGSRFDRSNDRIDTTILDNRITGGGTVEAAVVAENGIPISRLEVHTPRYEVTRAGATAPFAHGEGFHLVAKSANLDLTDPFADVHLTADLEREEIPDLSVYNAFFPKASRTRIVSGAGRMTWHLEGDSNEHALHGTLRLDMIGLVLKFEEANLRGDVRIDTILKHGDPRGRAFDISGTVVTLRHRNPPWKGVVRFPRAQLEFSEPMRVTARTTLSLQDTRPLVMIYDAFKDVPPWIERLMTIEDVKGGAGFVVRPEAVDIDGLAIEGKGLRAKGDLTLSDQGKEGILYIRIHGFSLGIRLQPGKERGLKIVRPLAWFEEERAARRRRRASAVR